MLPYISPNSLPLRLLPPRPGWEALLGGGGGRGVGGGRGGGGRVGGVTSEMNWGVVIGTSLGAILILGVAALVRCVFSLTPAPPPPPPPPPPIRHTPMLPTSHQGPYFFATPVFFLLFLQGLSEQPQSFCFSPTLFFLSLLFFRRGSRSSRRVQSSRLALRLCTPAKDGAGKSRRMLRLPQLGLD